MFYPFSIYFNTHSLFWSLLIYLCLDGENDSGAASNSSLALLSILKGAKYLGKASKIKSLLSIDNLNSIIAHSGSNGTSENKFEFLHSTEENDTDGKASLGDGSLLLNGILSGFKGNAGGKGYDYNIDILSILKSWSIAAKSKEYLSDFGLDGCLINSKAHSEFDGDLDSFSVLNLSESINSEVVVQSQDSVFQISSIDEVIKQEPTVKYTSSENKIEENSKILVVKDGQTTIDLNPVLINNANSGEILIWAEQVGNSLYIMVNQPTKELEDLYLT